MRKITLIILVIALSPKAKAQDFGVKIDAGMSRINKIYNPYLNIKNKSKLYYGIGIFYAKISESSKWGFRTSLDFNKRGAGSYYEGFWNNYSGGESFVVSETNESTKSLSITFTPTLNVSKRLQFLLGPSFGYTLGSGSESVDTYYKTESKNEVIDTYSNISEFNGVSFTDRLHFGLNVGFNIKVADRIDLGLTYQYARILKYASSYYRPFYNIVNISTSIYFKKRD
jgi:hypothetical protein